MNINFYMPTKVISGENCIIENKELLYLGKRCIIVTGASSAVKCGALDDVIDALSDMKIDYIIYDKVKENPLLSCAYDGGIAAAAFDAEFVIGIGGGSPMDCAKAIAAFAANSTISPEKLFDVASLAPSLPLVLVPTTSGTGSEANPYSVLSLDGEDKKQTFNSPYSYPKYAFLDPKYTYSLSPYYTMSTALDAFCHCFESFMSPKSTEVSRLFALAGAKDIWNSFDEIEGGEVSFDARAKLMYASFFGGVAINTTGTAFPHPLGYNLTFNNDIAHGRACGAFIGEYIEYQKKDSIGSKLLAEFAACLECDIDTIACRIPALSKVDIRLSDDEIEMFTEKIKSAGNHANAPYKISTEEIKEIYKKLFK